MFRPQAFVIFEDSDWHFMKPLKKYFRHVSVMVEVSPGQYVHLDPRMNNLDLSVYDGDAIEFMMSREFPHIRIVETEALGEHERTHVITLYTCVEVVKRVLGIYSWRVQTPRQLYNYLKRRERNETR